MVAQMANYYLPNKSQIVCGIVSLFVYCYLSDKKTHQGRG